jgi:serine/threonine-protein kinase
MAGILYARRVALDDFDDEEASLGPRPKHLLRTLSSALRRAVGEVDSDVRKPEPIGMGTKLGPYTLEQKLGQGGMGAVYRARHDRLPRPVAVKLLRTRGGGEESLELFEREVQLTSRLAHPSTVQIFDFGVARNGIYYYVMEYIDGLTLDDLVLDYGALPPGRVIYVVAQVAHALAEAHEQGLIHRDIKPANILLCDRGGVADLPKLVDFGLVADLQAPIDPSDSRPRVLLGTPMYMAPEALLETHRVDARTDLYALGAVAYFLLTGLDIFDDPIDVDTLIRYQIHAEPRTPSERMARKAPKDLERLIMSCLAKDPKDRPHDALSFREALLDCLDAKSWGMREAEAWWAEQGVGARRRRADGSRLSGTSRDDTTRIPEWQRRTDRIRG